MQSTGNGPDFICIGAQKSGTTWLYENLAHHPQVWPTPVKELHYFNRVCLNTKLLGTWDMPHPVGISRYMDAALSLNANRLRWLRTYYEYGLSKKWYLSLFDHRFSKGLVCGDITPGYSTLEEPGIRYVKSVVRDTTPIIFIVRDPIQRAWSAAKMLLRYYRKSVQTMPHDELMNLLNTPHITLCSEYSRIIPLWKSHFSNFHVLSYDQLCSDPKGFLANISQILRIDNTWQESAIAKRIWSDEKKISVPQEALTLLQSRYLKEIEFMEKHEAFPETRQWLKNLSNS